MTSAPSSSRLTLAGDVVAIPAPGDARDALRAFRVSDGAPAWETPTPGFVLTSALAGVLSVADRAGQTIYLAQGGHVAAVAAADGAIRWSRRVPDVEPFEDYTIAHTPAVDATRLYLLSRHARLVAIDRATGALAWSADDLDPATQLSVGDGVVITRSAERDELRAFDLATGALRWARPLTPSPTSRPYEATAVAQRTGHRDGMYLVVDGDRTVVAVDAATGATRWEEPIVAPATWAWAGARLIVADAASVRAIDHRAGTVSWRQPTGGHALVAPLDGSAVVLALPSAVTIVDVSAGTIAEVAQHRLRDDDRVIAAAAGGAIVTVDGHARWYVRAGASLRERDLGEFAVGLSASQHALVQIELTSAGALTLDRSGTIARFAR